ncbi:hypothetical protein ANCDUO_04950 [Ancylostoma duodenale]|uniref:Ig-like domain-containing protein n=1 Tax=Ancylostoma duodenale TaxID=51022 RepID=A0A0C2H5M6_9BILA|nr:hypothetical protein ANCDUO_04950 [Ancylostoma duodenale]
MLKEKMLNRVPHQMTMFIALLPGINSRIVDWWEIQNHPGNFHDYCHRKVMIHPSWTDPPDQPKVSMVGDPYVRAGDNVTLACVVTGGNPPPDVSWYLKDRLLSARFQYDLQTQPPCRYTVPTCYANHCCLLLRASLLEHGVTTEQKLATICRSYAQGSPEILRVFDRRKSPAHI